MDFSRYSPRQCRGVLAVFFFLTVILSKCAWVEVARMHYGLDIRSHLFVWLPSLLLGGLCVFLYSAGPNSPLRGLLATRHGVLLGIGWLLFTAVAIAIVPSPALAGLIALLVAGVFLYLGKGLGSRLFLLLGVVWVALAAIFPGIDPGPAYTLLGAALLLLAALPGGWQALYRP